MTLKYELRNVVIITLKLRMLFCILYVLSLVIISSKTNKTKSNLYLQIGYRLQQYKPERGRIMHRLNRCKHKLD